MHHIFRWTKLAALLLIPFSLAGVNITNIYENDCRNERRFESWPAAAAYFSSEEGGCLRFEQEKASLSGTLLAFPLDPVKVCGKRIQVSCQIKGEGISNPLRTYLGPKIMMVCPMPEQVYYWDFSRRYGTFDWEAATLSVFIPEEAKNPSLAFGLQGCTGKFSIRDLQIKTIEESQTVRLPTNSGKAYGQKTKFRGVMSGHDLSEASIRELGETWGANLIRYQIVNAKKIKFNTFEEYSSWLNQELATLDRLLPLFRKYGIKVLIDLHSGPMLQQNNLLHNALSQNPTQQQYLVEVWKNIAARYANQSGIWGYDILNEPREDSYVYRQDGGDDWNGLSSRVAKAIRELDPNTPIIVEPAMVGNPEGLRAMRPIEVSNVIYSIHFYKPSSYTFQGIFTPQKQALRYPGTIDGKEYNKERLRLEMKPIIDFQNRYQVPIYIGEFSVIRWAPNASEYLSDLISLFEEYGWDWTYHAYREWSGWSVEHSDDPELKSILSEDTARKRVLLDAFRRNRNPAAIPVR